MHASRAASVIVAVFVIWENKSTILGEAKAAEWLSQGVILYATVDTASNPNMQTCLCAQVYRRSSNFVRPHAWTSPDPSTKGDRANLHAIRLVKYERNADAEYSTVIERSEAWNS